MSDAAIKKGSGKTWDEWFALLDAWGGNEKTHAEIARYISEELGVDGWWAQGVTVGYERARGRRVVNQTSAGFVANVSKTFSMPVRVLYDAFAFSAIRDAWMEPGTLHLRSSQKNRSARFDVLIKPDTRLEVWFTDKGPEKSSAALQHVKLESADDLVPWKAFWKARLERLAKLAQE
jgi:hypothetical protein